MIPNVTFEELRRCEISDFIEVVRRTFPHDFEVNGEFNKELCLQMFRFAVIDTFEFVIVAKTNHRIIGFVFYQNKPPTNGEIYLNMIGVHPDFQGQGIA